MLTRQNARTLTGPTSVDILGKTATRHNLATGAVRTYALPTTVGTIVPRRGGGAVVALDAGPAALDFGSGATVALTQPLVQPATNRCNDGKCGPDGRFYFGTMHSPSIPDRPPVGKVRPAARVSYSSGVPQLDCTGRVDGTAGRSRVC